MDTHHDQSVQPTAASLAYSTEPIQFKFRSAGKVTKDGVEVPLPARAAVTLDLSFLTLTGLAGILNSGDEKQINFVLETLKNPILDLAKDQVDANLDITTDGLDTDKLTWEYISNMEPVVRRGNGIAKEVWEDFVKDYITVMPAATGRKVEVITRAATLLGQKLSSCKGQKKILQFLRDQLDVYFAATTRQADFVDCYQFLINKADTLILADAEDILKNLMG
jgi:hypothetical protein